MKASKVLFLNPVLQICWSWSSRLARVSVRPTIGVAKQSRGRPGTMTETLWRTFFPWFALYFFYSTFGYVWHFQPWRPQCFPVWFPQKLQRRLKQILSSCRQLHYIFDIVSTFMVQFHDLFVLAILIQVQAGVHPIWLPFLLAVMLNLLLPSKPQSLSHAAVAPSHLLLLIQHKPTQQSCLDGEHQESMGFLGIVLTASTWQST